MIDLNHGSSYQYAKKQHEGTTVREAVNVALDVMLTAKQKHEKPRDYVSTSGIARECERQIQYDFMAVPKDPGRDFAGQTLRIFAAGHYWEDRVAEWLKEAGFDLRTAQPDGSQYGFKLLNGRIKGHIDGVITGFSDQVMRIAGGLPPFAVPCLWEHKALNAKNWKEVVRKGCQVAKPIYYGQIQMYMAYMELHENPCLFMVLNKDTMEIFCELIHFNQRVAQELSDKAYRVVQASEAEFLLPRAFQDRSHFGCTWCDYADRCWGKRS